MTELQWLGENLLSMSPEIEALLYNRVYAVALQAILWAAVLYLAGTYLCIVAARSHKRDNGDFEEYGIGAAISAVILLVGATLVLTMAIGRLNSPGYFVMLYIKNGLFS